LTRPARRHIIVTMSPTYDALYRAVLVAPDDDLPRLVLADWLEENGDGGRAAELRVGVADRQSTICALPRYEASGATAVLRRGFVDSIHLYMGTFVRDRAVLFAEYPIVGVTFMQAAPLDNMLDGYGSATGMAPWIWLRSLTGDLYDRFHERAAVLPDMLFQELDDAVGFESGEARKNFPSRDAAELALSRAAVKVGRKAAGLPPYQFL
jgi:uncharacterized protein (TIGR02996 family)